MSRYGSSYSVSSTPLCPLCGSHTAQRQGRFGPFYGCTNYPKCRGIAKTRYTAPVKQAVAVAAKPYVPATGSPEQDAIWNEIVTGTGHLVVQALAGTGKSFTCRESMHRVDPSKRVLYLAFSKAIADEFRADAPANCTVKTINAMGYAVCMANLSRTRRDVNRYKVRDIMENIWKPRDGDKAEEALARTLYNAVDKLVGLCMAYLDDGSDKARLIEFCDRYDVELEDEICERVYAMVPQVLLACRTQLATISFNDQVWLPVVLGYTGPKYDIIYVDEAQDMNPLQHAFVMMLLAPTGRIIIVGDKNQAVFGFRGSDVDSMDNMAALLAKNNAVVTLPLTVSRRCPKAVVRYAQQWVPDYAALDDAPEGEIITARLADIMGQLKPGDMGICRTNAPLTGVAYSCIRRGVKVIIRGHNIGQGLIALIERLRPDSVNELLRKLDAWQAEQIAKVSGTRREAIVTERVTDQADCIRTLAEDMDTVKCVKDRIEKIFADFDADGTPRDAVVLSSIHRAKGLESERVIWIKPEITCRAEKEWQAQQEINLKYVATTRTKFTRGKCGGTLILAYAKGGAVSEPREYQQAA